MLEPTVGKFRRRIVRSTIVNFILASAASALVMAPSATASCDPDTWLNATPVPPGNPLTGVAFGDGIHLAVGFNAEILRSVNGAVWFDVSPVQGSFNYLDIVFDDGQFVACGADGRIDVLTGPNAGAVTFGSGVVFSSVAYGNGAWVVVGGSFDLSTGWSEVIITSTNGGLTWTPTLVNPVGGALDVLSGVAFGDGVFISVDGDGDIRTSANGSTWSAPQNVTTDLNAIAYEGGVFIACGPSGRLRRSVNAGATWSSIDFGANAWFDIDVNKGNWVVVGQNGAIATSANNGTSWSSAASGTTDAIEAVNGGDNAWIAVGTSNPGNQRLLFSQCVTSLPDLEPFTIADWSGPLVVSTTPGTNTSATEFTEADTIYIDAAWANIGGIDTGPFTASVDINGGPPADIPSPGIPSFGLQFIEDLTAGPLAPGDYTVTLTLDSGETVPESNESNNIATFDFTIPEPCAADLDGDGSVGSADLAQLLGQWGMSGVPEDLDGDGSVGSADLAQLIGNWGPCP